MTQKQYTFHDWESNRLITLKGEDGNFLGNDSGRYEYLVDSGLMLEKTLMEIVTAQVETYNKIVRKTVEIDNHFFIKNLKTAAYPDRLLDWKIKEKEKQLTSYDHYYETVIQQYKDKPFGSRYILPFDYLKCIRGEPVDVFSTLNSFFTIKLLGKTSVFPQIGQRTYLIVETIIKWLDILKNTTASKLTIETPIDNKDLDKKSGIESGLTEREKIQMDKEHHRLIQGLGDNAVETLSRIHSGLTDGQIHQRFGTKITTIKSHATKARKLTGKDTTPEAIEYLLLYRVFPWILKL